MKPVHAVLLFLLAVILTAPGIAAFGPLDRDESRFVQATKQMAETGDHLDIRFQEEARYKKPVGIYWLQSAVVEASGLGAAAPIWVYRTVSVLAVAGVVVAVAWTGATLFGPAAGLAAGLVMVGMFACGFEGRIAKTDAALLLASVIAQGALAGIYVGARRDLPPSALLAWTFWIAMAVGILIKGPITPMLAGLTVAALVVADRDWRWLRHLRAGWGILLACAIVAPWLIAITIRSDGAFWQESVGRDLLGKVAQGQEAHGAPPGYYVLTYGLYFWPFGLIAITAGMHAISQLRSEPALRFLFAWYVPFWVMFELIATKLPHYMLPAYPALALMAGWGVARFDRQAVPDLSGWRVWLPRLAWLGQLLVTVGLAAAVIGLPVYLNHRTDPWSIAAALLVIAAGYLGWVAARTFSMRHVLAGAVAAGAGYAVIFGAVLPSLDAVWISPRVAAAVEQNKPCGTTVLASAGFHEPSLVFLVGTQTLLTTVKGAAAHVLDDPACAVALLPSQDQAVFEAQLAKHGLRTVALAQIDGLNYSNGKRLALGLYRAEAGKGAGAAP